MNGKLSLFMETFLHLVKVQIIDAIETIVHQTFWQNQKI
jgi:hypothetical protein